MRQPRQSAFSLLELSIVLVILGLLVGGVMAGQSLIRGAELRSVITESTRYITAIGNFRNKYNALPGDMSNATTYWGATNNGNGDGDNMIENHATAANNEISLFWIHLAGAAFIEGSYTNVGYTTTSMVPGTNIPKAKIGNGGWNIIFLGTVQNDGTTIPTSAAGTTASGTGTFFDGTYNNALLLGTGSNAILPGGIMKAEDAWNTDVKMDDGAPATGNVMSLESQGSNVCSNLAGDTSATLSAAVYKLDSTTTNACSLVFKSEY